MSVERDLYLTEKTIGDYLKASDKEVYDYYKELEKE